MNVRKEILVVVNMHHMCCNLTRIRAQETGPSTGLVHVNIARMRIEGAWVRPVSAPRQPFVDAYNACSYAGRQ